MFFALLAWLPGPWRRIPFAWQLFLVVFVEAAWEVLENSSFVINRYRTETIALEYTGDSIINSLADILACAAGAFIARALGPWRTLLLFLAMEIALLFWIRDNLTLNVVMLVHPVQGIKAWQSAGH